MSSVDILLAVVFGLSAFRGYRKGIILELFSLAALIITLLFGMKLTGYVAAWLQTMASDSRWIPFAAYLLAFAGIYILVIWLGKLVESAANIMQLGLINRVLGAVAGLLKTAFFVSLVFWLAAQVRIIPDGFKEKSIFYPWLADFAPKVFKWLSDHIPFLKDLIRHSESLFHKGPFEDAGLLR